MRVKICLPLRGKAAGVILGAAALMTAGGALAEMSPQLKAALQKLGNVRVETAATPAAVSQPTPGSAGLRAFKDPVTGELVEPEAGEIVSDRSKSAPAHGAPIVAYRPMLGGIRVELDESFMVNAVVSKGADGKLEMQCVGAEHAAAMMRDGKAGKAHRHDR